LCLLKGSPLADKKITLKKFLYVLMFLYSEIEWSRLHSNLPNPMRTWIQNYNWPH
jgi:hypothetical protein